MYVYIYICLWRRHVIASFCTSCDCGFGVGDSAKEIVSILVRHVIATACDCGFPVVGLVHSLTKAG